MSEHLARLEEVTRVALVRSPTTFTWFGKPSPRLRPEVRDTLAPADARAFLLTVLRGRLYEDYYTQGRAEAGEDSPQPVSAPGATPFVRELSRANCGAGTWQSGWAVDAERGEALELVRDGLRLRARESECAGEGPTRSLRLPHELLGFSPGFYLALSDEPLDERERGAQLRLYWNLTSQGAVPFVRAATGRLNAAGLPFRLKLLRDPARYTRCDGAVIYLSAGTFDAGADELTGVYAEVERYLKPHVPALTRRLRPGLGLAESPPDGESFGLHRCGLVAEALVRAHERTVREPAARLGLVRECFTEAGLHLEAPHLSSQAKVDYEMPDSSTLVPPRASAPTSEPRPIEVAAAIGRRLASEAVWHEDACNWLGPHPGEGSGAPFHEALGPDLYAGTSGIALLFAELFRASADESARRHALGAARCALFRVDDVVPGARYGLYAGWPGVACALARVGELVGEEELVTGAARLLERWAAEAEAGTEFDVISGRAGAILGLLALRETLGDGPCLERAVRIGDELAERAERGRFGCCWSTPGADHRGLTGFSHGASGAGLALLELSFAADEPRYAELAESAFGYERHWYDAEAENWPDFRGERSRGPRLRFPKSFTSAWCHGAPGVALSRLRAHELTGDRRYLDEARAGLGTTARMVGRWLGSGLGNYSLCHGLCGNADVLLTGGEFEAPRAVAAAGVREHMAAERPWVCGIAAGETPGLMLGLAGIAYYYLRLADRSTPSVLLFGPQSSTRSSPPPSGVAATPVRSKVAVLSGSPTRTG